MNRDRAPYAYPSAIVRASADRESAIQPARLTMRSTGGLDSRSLDSAPQASTKECAGSSRPVEFDPFLTSLEFPLESCCTTAAANASRISARELGSTDRLPSNASWRAARISAAASDHLVTRGVTVARPPKASRRSLKRKRSHTTNRSPGHLLRTSSTSRLTRGRW